MPKGVYLRTEKTKMRISESHRGNKNPLWGKHHTEETRKKMRESAKGRKMSEKAKKKISEAKKGVLNPNWKGGKTIKNGYIYILKPEHPYANYKGYVLEHRLVMEKMLGRYLRPEEIVHHKNEVRNDNYPDNLKLFLSSYKHLSFHKKEV